MSLDVNISEPEEFNCIELHSCLEDVANLVGFKDFKYHVDLISGKGDGYVANIFRVVIEDSESDKVKNVIVKTLINATRRELFRDIHKREVTVYKEVLPKFKKIQSKLDITQRIWFPECLYTNASKNKEVIILQDLTDIGFGIGDGLSKFEEPDYRRAKLVLTQLAKLHGLTFVYENIERENFNILKEKLQDLLFQENFLSKSKLRNYFIESYDISLKQVANVEVKKKLEKVRGNLLDILRSYSRPRKHNALCHGDLWLNNILFKQKGDRDEICFLDYQVMRYCCPANDIIHFIYLSTTSKFRSEHFEDLQQAYYDSLSSFLNLYDMDINAVYPRTDFEEDLKEFLPYGLIIALVEMRIVTTSPGGDTILSENKSESDYDLSKVPLPSEEMERFKYRINDLVEESVKNGVLDKLLKN